MNSQIIEEKRQNNPITVVLCTAARLSEVHFFGKAA
jgi:hypothetical protein